MPLILNIDTALEYGSVSLSDKGTIISFLENKNQQDHAAWIHTAIKEMMAENNIQMSDIDSVSVSNGPGSYTGLRIGLSAAKGLCFALQIPLITVGTLDIMAAGIQRNPNNNINATDWLCPMIDARRMEVYYALYDAGLSLISSPQAAIVQAGFFDDWLKQKKIFFFGNGSHKLKKILSHKNADFLQYHHKGAFNMAALSEKYYYERKFADLAYTEPLYIKEVYFPGGNPS